MSGDASFEDGAEKPINIGAFDLDDLKVVASLVQDSVFPISEMTWRAKNRRLAILLNRFRWEDKDFAERDGRALERVQSIMVVEHVDAVSSQGVDRSDKETVLSLLDITFENIDDVSGYVTLILAGDGIIRAKVEALEVSLKDVTRPYVAPSKSVPRHPS